MLDRSFFGLPAEWGQVSSWMSQKALPDMPTMLAKPELAKKCQEVPTLLDYRRPPHLVFGTFSPPLSYLRT
jgi:hypothetical protein